MIVIMVMIMGHECIWGVSKWRAMGGEREKDADNGVTSNNTV
jgi:hypothetical protein